MQIRPIAMGAAGDRPLAPVSDQRTTEQVAAEAIAVRAIRENALDPTTKPWYDGGDGGDADADA